LGQIKIYSLINFYKYKPFSNSYMHIDPH